MKIFISKWIVALLLVVMGVVAVAVVYTTQFAPMLAENKKLEEQIVVYEKSISVLANHKLNEEKYKSESERIQKEAEELLADFPVELRYEDQLLYVDYLEENLGYDIGTLNIGADYSIYSMSNNRALCSQYITIPYTTTYNGFKELITFFNGDDNKTDDQFPASIVNISVSYDAATDTMSGTMVLRRYYVTGLGAYVPPKIPENLFPVGGNNILD